MKIIESELLLTFQKSPSNGTEIIEYILHADSTFGEIAATSNGNNPIPTQLDGDGILQVELLIIESESSDNNNTPSNAKHHVYLGSFNFGVTAFDIDVSILNQNNELRGKGRVRNTSAQEASKPIKSN